MSDATFDWPLAICLEVQNDPQFVASSAEPGCTLEASSLTSQLTWPVDVSAEVPSNLKTHLHLPLPAGHLLSSITERASGGTPVARDMFSVSHKVGASDLHQTDTGSHSGPVLSLWPLSKSPRVY